MAANSVEASSAVLVRLDVGHELDEFVGFPVQVEEVQRKSGRGSQELLRIGSPLGLYAEEFEPTTARHLGNFPQAFSHLALMEAAARIIVPEMLAQY